MTHAVVVESLEKFFPPARSGWRAMLHPFVRPTMRALAGISLAVAQGEALAVLGANGAGKSTLLRVLATLIPPTRGRAAVAGFDVEREPARVREQIGYYAGSDHGFYSRLTARKNLEFFAPLNNLAAGDSVRAITRVTELLDLGEASERQVRTLSTGTVHRLGLARALLHAPAVLLLDEPTRSLDPLTAAEFRRFLKNELVRKRGATLVFASHSLAEIEQLADRIAVLHAGSLLACGTLAELMAAVGAASPDQMLERLTHRVARAEQTG